MAVTRNPFPWSVLPGPKARAAGYCQRHFPNKKRAVSYLRLVRAEFPDEEATLNRVRAIWDSGTRLFRTRGEALDHDNRAREYCKANETHYSCQAM